MTASTATPLPACPGVRCQQVAVVFISDIPRTHPTPACVGHEGQYQWCPPAVVYSQWCCFPDAAPPEIRGAKLELPFPRATVASVYGWYWLVDSNDPQGTMPRLWFSKVEAPQ